ncbi:M15 family metallopeptidase [Gordonia aurantiaca]|uniref:M15 family metallopeptidase n=1 Tax=Gordonia sp. B21 TaxID=3151852 RepID=UPI003264C354
MRPFLPGRASAALAGVAIAAVVSGTAPAGTTTSAAPAVFAPGTEGLEPALAGAYTVAANEAHAQGVTLWITSGKRSDAEQRRLWRDAIAAYGSPEAARRWVLPAEESPHVRGKAVDVGPQAGAAWLERNGHRWGLCRTFVNEWWHFELATTLGAACPPMWPDAAVRADRLAGRNR